MERDLCVQRLAMARRDSDPARGSLLLAEELLERGDPAFADELRRGTDADRLGAFAARWYAGRRPEPDASLLLTCLGRSTPSAMKPWSNVLSKLPTGPATTRRCGWFTVALDRSVRRVLRQAWHYDYRTQTSWTEERLRMPQGTTMPRPAAPVAERFPECRLSESRRGIGRSLLSPPKPPLEIVTSALRPGQVLGKIL